jgi:AcrR family transcriptional regulator
MDPRVARTHDAVMKAARELLLEGGPAALTVDGVVARSGVAKSTVYRHWATRHDLVMGVLSSCAPHIEPVADDLSFEAALRELVDGFVAVLVDEHWSQVLPALLMLKNEVGELADLEDSIRDQQTEVVRSVLQRGVDEGLLPDTVLGDVDRALTLLSGPLLLAGLTDSVPLDDHLVDEVVHQFLAGQARVVAARTPA